MSEARSIKAVIFDLDSTLYPESDYVKSGFRHISSIIERKFGIKADVAFDGLMKIFESGKRGKSFNELLDMFNVSYTNEDIVFLVKEYRRHDPVIVLPASSQFVLESLKMGGYKTGLITDGYHEAQVKKVSKLGLTRFVDEIIYTDELGREFWKPHTKPFQLICDLLGVASKACVYVGDDPRKDFLGANRCGMLTVQTRQWVKNECILLGKDYLPRHQIDDLREIFSIIGVKNEQS